MYIVTDWTTRLGGKRVDIHLRSRQRQKQKPEFEIRQSDWMTHPSRNNPTSLNSASSRAWRSYVAALNINTLRDGAWDVSGR